MLRFYSGIKSKSGREQVWYCQKLYVHCLISCNLQEKKWRRTSPSPSIKVKCFVFHLSHVCHPDHPLVKRGGQNPLKPASRTKRCRISTKPLKRSSSLPKKQVPTMQFPAVPACLLFLVSTCSSFKPIRESQFYSISGQHELGHGQRFKLDILPSDSKFKLCWYTKTSSTLSPPFSQAKSFTC